MTVVRQRCPKCGSENSGCGCLPSRCPYCGDYASDIHDEIAHMQTHHPEVIAQRLRDAGMHDEAAKWER